MCHQAEEECQQCSVSVSTANTTNVISQSIENFSATVAAVLVYGGMTQCLSHFFLSPFRKP